jgi:hypothetical protein
MIFGLAVRRGWGEAIGWWQDLQGLDDYCPIHLRFKPQAHSENPFKRVEMPVLVVF